MAADASDDLELELREKVLDVVTEMTLANPEREMEIWDWFTKYCDEIVNPVDELVIVPEFE